MENNYIKRCPHCGGISILCSNYSFRTRSHFVFVKCTMCGSQGKIYSSEEDPEEADWNNEACLKSIAAWNMRTGEKGQENA